MIPKRTRLPGFGDKVRTKLLLVLGILFLLPETGICKQLRVMTYNVWGLPSPLLRHSERFRRLPGAINSSDADIVLIQEAFNKESKALAQLSRFPYHAWGPSSKFLKFSSGLLIISRFPIIESSTIIYSRCGGFDCFANKGAVYARILIPGRGEISVFNTHLNANGHEITRAVQANQLMQFIEAKSGGLPTIVGGDFNGEAKPLFQKIQSSLFLRDAHAEFAEKNPKADPEDLEAFTADPKRNPFLSLSETQRRLDHLFVLDGSRDGWRDPTFKEHWQVLKAKVVYDGRNGRVLSDHFGLSAIFDLSVPERS